MESLYFSNADFFRIPDAFLHLNALRHLNIIATPVNDWNIGALAYIGKTLQTLNIEEVEFTTWPPWLRCFENLNELSIQSNAISSIPDNGFDHLADNLQVLTLSNNSLTDTPKALVILKNVESLDLGLNKISNVTWLPHNSKLFSLALNLNSISDAKQLSNVLRPFASTLDTVLLSHNRLTVIPDLSFLTRIDTFDLSYNLISDPASGALHNETTMLDLSFNQLPSIPVIYRGLKLVSSMTLTHNLIHVVQGSSIPVWIAYLYLEFNLITELSDTSFPDNSSLQVLLLDGNPLVKISNLALKNLKFIYSLSLKNTKLTRLPLSLSYLTSIFDLDLSNNTGLVCTCLEKSLRDKITSNIAIIGDCGNIRIYDFFAILSSSCP
ncbi:unnamed protein product [Candidula unifasciata]|uniref:Uncharacterized protein n=1 Tax=Candidula unifasciata TaxID=100452 RepID=A0A8S3YEU0_9EUPU|nr:unnamed protein product [Candidula unifasciata]